MKSDEQLHSDVISELSWDPGLCAKRIHISVQHGVVTLTGHVADQWQRSAAERAVMRVHGIYGAAQKLEIDLAKLN